MLVQYFVFIFRYVDMFSAVLMILVKYLYVKGCFNSALSTSVYCSYRYALSLSLCALGMVCLYCTYNAHV